MCSTASFWERGLSLWFEICRVLKPFQLCFAAKTHESMSVSCFFLLRKVCSQVFGPWKISQNGTRKWSRWFYPNLLKLVAKLDTFDIFCFYGILAFCKSVLAAKSCFELDFPLKCSCSHFIGNLLTIQEDKLKQNISKDLCWILLGSSPELSINCVWSNSSTKLPLAGILYFTCHWYHVARPLIHKFVGNLKPMGYQFWLSIHWIKIYPWNKPSCGHWDSWDSKVGELVTLDNWVITLRRPAAALCLWKVATMGRGTGIRRFIPFNVYICKSIATVLLGTTCPRATVYKSLLFGDPLDDFLELASLYPEFGQSNCFTVLAPADFKHPNWGYPCLLLLF